MTATVAVAEGASNNNAIEMNSTSIEKKDMNDVAASNDPTNTNTTTTTSVAPRSDLIQRAMGDFGRWHLFVCVVIFLLKFPVAWHQMSIIFIAPPAQFECVNATIERCAAECPAHEFDRSVFTETIITQWDLVCDQAQLANVSQLVFMLGILIGNMLFGMVADKIGRRIPLVVAVFIQIASGIATAFVPWYWLYVVMRFITAVSTGGTMTTSFVLIMEIIGIQYREFISVMFHVPFNLGHLSLPLFAYYIRDWHHLQLALSVPSILLISYYWLVPESPRWLFTAGRVEESAAVLKQAAKYNRLPNADGIETDLMMLKKESASSASGSSGKGNVWDLLRTPNMRLKTLAMWFNWFVCGLAFFGVSQYIGHIGGDIFANVATSAALEVPGTLICIWTMRRFGRRMTVAFANMFTGVAMLIIAFLPADASVVRLVCASCGIIGMNMSFPTIYLFSGEIFPTVVRNIGVGSSSMAARIGTMLAPFVASFAISTPVLPPLIFGLVPMVGAAVVLLLPETNGTALPETLEDGEAFGKKVQKVEELRM